MARLLTFPRINWGLDGAPVAAAHDDVYYSAEDGLEETRAVFLHGCGLPEGWTGRGQFTVAETGFGTGLNFLALWQLWRKHRPAPDAQLTFVSFERYPLAEEDARRALSAWPELEHLSMRLLSRWPAPVRGVRELRFPDDGVRLVLHLGDIADMLPEAVFQADAWFLDGFSPAKNADMWSPQIYPEIARHSAPGATLGTFTVAGAVRRGLAGVGFEVRKAEGHGRKRERLEARLALLPQPLPDTFGLRSPQERPRRIAILGAGIAGAVLAHRLKADGFEPEVFDPAPTPASGASGNPLGLLMPRLDGADTAEAALLIDAYLAARSFYRGLPEAEETDVLQLPRNAVDVARFEKLIADPPLPLEDLEAARGGALLHKRALIVKPAPLIARLLEGVTLHLGAPVSVDMKTTSVCGSRFEAVILANGMQAAAIAPILPLEARLGQVDWSEGSVAAPPSAIVSGSYALAIGHQRLWGATFKKADGSYLPEGTSEARQENFAALEKLSPWWLSSVRSGPVLSRASLRATTPDRLPLIGAVPDAAAAETVFAGLKKGRAAAADAPSCTGLYVSGGFGARGFTWAPWAAAILSARLAGAPSTAPRRALEAVSPMRFVLRALRRG